jgi:predicted peptidase
MPADYAEGYTLKGVNMKKYLAYGLLMSSCAFGAAKDWQALYEPLEHTDIPCRVMKPIGFDASKDYPVILSLHGGGGKGADNRKQLKVWNQQLADQALRTKFPGYVVAPQAAGLWNAENLAAIKKIIAALPSVDMDRIYILGHSMGGHGTYIFIQLDPDYFAAAAPSAGSGLKKTEPFIDAAKIRDIPVWAFHGDQDKTCPFEKQQKLFDEMKAIGGTMKLTVWKGGNHGVSDLFIPGAENGTTHCTSDRCDKEADFMTWLFNQKRKQRTVNGR